MKRLAKALVIARIKENAKQKPHSWQHKPGPWDRKANGGRVASEKVLPPNHQLGMKVPKGGSSCSKCRFLATPTTCGNKGFIKWNGEAKLPAPSNEYCCDLYEVAKGYADGGRIHKADGGPALSDEDMGIGAAPAVMSDADMGLADAPKTPSWSDAFTDIPHEIGAEAGNALDKIKALGNRADQGPIEGLMTTGKAALAVPQLIASPVTGAARSLIGHP